MRDVRGKGAIGVVELERIVDLNKIRMHFIEEGVFVRPFGNVIYLTPAFTIGEYELNKLISSVMKILRNSAFT